MKNKICAVVIWYNPTRKMRRNLYTYFNCVDKIYIVDNSSESNEKLIKGLNCFKIEYISNSKNLGIGKALNIACQKAIKDKYDWILTMDQDSYFEKNSVKNYLIFLKKNNEANENIAIIAPKYRYSYEFEVKNNDNLEYNEISKVITSGNMVNLKIYLEIGKFNEDFFIDQVDFEYCKRVTNLKRKIIQLNTVCLNHTLGNSELKNILGIKFVITNHAPIRRYYMSRNIMYMSKYYPELKFKYYIFIILEIFKILIFENENKKEKIAYIIKGIKDFFKKKMGALK